MIYLLIFLLISPSIWITNNVNINLLDFSPFLIILVLIIKKNIKLRKEELLILKINFILISLTLISTFFAFLYFNTGNINPFLQFYRRIIDLFFIPFFVFIYFDKIINLKQCVTKSLIFIFLIVAFIGELVNFIGIIREFLFIHFVSLHQILIPGIFRNEGFIGEASYFANILFLGFIFILFTNIKYKVYILLLFVIFIITTFSKSVILSMLITMICYSFYYKKIGKFFITLLLILLIILTLIFYFDLWNAICLYFTTRAESSFSERTNILWIKSINFISENPIAFFTGLGFKGFKYYAGIAGAHNEYISLFGNFGLISIAYFLLFFFLNPFLIWKITQNKLFIFITIFFLIESFVHEPLIHAKVLAVYMFLFSIIIKDYLNKRDYYIYEKSINS